ncbi:MAG: hypothetical protein ACREJB_00965 [Planctomycetaceae bacterium]
MKRIDLTRRDFHKLTMAAFGGLLAGTVAGCDDGAGDADATTGTETGHDPQHAAGAPSHEPAAGAGGELTPEEVLLTSEPHVCRGLNLCKQQGNCAEVADLEPKANACAGQGGCATAEAHSCHTQNACKGQGGCGEIAGRNSCKGKGECAVPLMPDAWTSARAAFETAYKKKTGKDLGPAPPKS